MTKLKLGPILTEKPVRLSIELPAALHRDLLAYAEALARQTGETAVPPARLIPPMLEHFIASDRGFAKARRTLRQEEGRSDQSTLPPYSR